MSNLRGRLPPLSSLAAFDAACRLGSFTRAAGELNLTQAAISRQIRALETDLGVILFERRRHDVALTPDGERYARTVNPAINAIGDATAAIKAESETADQLVIFSEMSLAAYCLVPRLSRFQARHPQLGVKLLTSNRSMELEAEPFDVALQYGAADKRAFHSRPISSDEIIPVCSPSFRECLPDPCRVEDLAAAPLIHLEQPGRGWVTWPEFLARFGVPMPGAQPGLVFNTYSSAIAAAIEGSGVVLGWRLIVDREMQDGKLLRLVELSLPSADDLCAHLPIQGRKSVLVEAFVSWLAAEIRAGVVARAAKRD